MVPAKIKHFCWKTIDDFLPNNLNLKKQIKHFWRRISMAALWIGS